MEVFSNWIRGLVAASVMTALSAQMIPRGPVKKITEALCGVMLMGILLNPLAKADTAVFSYALADYRRMAAELTQDMEAEEKQLLRSYIEQKCGAYILDEAAALGAEDLEVQVSAAWENETWIPKEARVKGILTQPQRSQLSGFMEAELGIPEVRQFWNG